MKLDYSSLSLPVTQADIAAYKATKNEQTLKTQKWLVVGFIIIGVIIVGSIMMPAIIDLLSGQMIALVPFVSWGGVFAFITGIALVYGRYIERRQAKLYRFVTQNNLQLIEDRANPGYAGMIFDEGHTRKINEAIILPEGTEIGNYEYVTGSGKNRSTHTYGYVKIPLTRNLPHMVLDGKANNLFGIITGLSDSFDRSQKLSLEGDFDNYFTLYAPKEYERDALYVFTPDVMRVLVEEGQRFDMEIVDNYLYVYSNVRFDLTSPERLASLVKIVDTVGSEIRSQTKRYADEKVGVSQVGAIARGGRRLNKGMSFAVLAVLGIILLNVALTILDVIDSPISIFIYVAIGLGIWAVIVIAFLSRFKIR